MTLPTDPKERKRTPIYSGFLAYFPDAVRLVALGMAPDSLDIAGAVMAGDYRSAALLSLIDLQDEIDDSSGWASTVDGSVTGLLLAFPDACADIARLSHIGNEQHNPGEPLHWAREKSTDQEDCIIRHLMQRGTVDTDEVRHSTKVSWRCFAALQLSEEAKLTHKTEPPVTIRGEVPSIPPSFYSNFWESK